MNTMKTSTATELLRETHLSPADAARLILEGVEMIGNKAQQLQRRELIVLIRSMIQEGWQALQARENTVSFESAAWQSVSARSGRRPTTRRDLRHYVRRMLRVDGIKDRPLRDMSTRECRELLQTAFGSSASSYKKGRAILHSIFAFGIRREWADTNPVDRIETPDIREKYIPPLTPEESQQLISATSRIPHREMAFSVHLMLYCGIRPTEVQRLKNEDIDWQQGKILIRSQISKTGGGRLVSLRGWKKNKLTQIPGNWQRRWKALRKDAGFHQWTPDTCRHTFASYHAAYFNEPGILQMEMGHRNQTLLRTRYVSPVSAQQAKRFWHDKAKLYSTSNSISNIAPNAVESNTPPSTFGLRSNAAGSTARRVKNSSG